MDQSERTLSLRLLNSRERPFIYYSSGSIDVTALIDTGALTPVWCMGKKRFLKAYPEALKQADETCLVSGFGEMPIEGETYIIPEFILHGEGSPYVVKNLYVAVCRHPRIGCDFVLSDTMFSHTDTMIRRRGLKRLEISFNRPYYMSTPRFEVDGFTISTWAQVI